MIKAPKKLYRSTKDRLLGRVSPSLFYRYLWSGDPEVVEFAKKTGYYLVTGCIDLNEPTNSNRS